MFFVAVLMVAPAATAGVTLDEVDLLAGGGAPGLALDLLDAHQPRLGEDPAGWRRWEEERLRLYQANRDWHALVARVDNYPRNLPEDFLAHGATLAVRAELAMERAAAARQRLWRLLWGRPRGPAEYAPLWRRLVIRSYLREGREGDAYTALVRYQLDYGDGDPEWVPLKARVLLRADRPQEVVTLLAVPRGPEERVLALQARTRLRTLSWADAVVEAEALAAVPELSPATRGELWTAVAAAAATPAERLFAVERALAADPGRSNGEGALDGTSLWSAYQDRARELANGKQLLVGRYRDWFALAAAQAAADPAAARALYAYLSRHAERAPDRERAVRDLVDGLMTADLASLLPRLFLAGRADGDLEAVPPAARHVLVDQLLATGDVVLASRLLSGLTGVPEGGDPFAWRLRRARVLILGGRVAEGIRELETLLGGFDGLDPDRIDRINQVLFDLQSLGEAEAALGFLQRLYGLADNDRVRRELLYWSADALKVLGRHREAARYYLRSALLPGPHAMDPWARSARFQAAAALAKAGFGADARSLYQGLLAVAEDPARRAVLRRAIQDLNRPAAGAAPP